MFENDDDYFNLIYKKLKINFIENSFKFLLKIKNVNNFNKKYLFYM